MPLAGAKQEREIEKILLNLIRTTMDEPESSTYEYYRLKSLAEMKGEPYQRRSLELHLQELIFSETRADNREMVHKYQEVLRTYHQNLNR